MWSPLEWVTNSLQPKERKQDSQEVVKQAREKAKESGTANVFEYDDVVPTTSATDGAVQRAKPDKVRPTSFLQR